ncbi:hypothetical protein IAC76_04360 [Spirochaetes bacterium]|uniref:Uncharacterized protein n=1 Tax=Candidatus Scatousia excrementipullorum TaxID=2840936 RepID=A0A9D9H0M4_9BACT|nr:hypothetical protein [Candidatus Scatousia excrementipullorum]
MDFTAILIGLGIIVALIIIGKIFAILTRIFFIIILVAAIAIGAFFWFNNNKETQQPALNQIYIENNLYA